MTVVLYKTDAGLFEKLVASLSSQQAVKWIWVLHSDCGGAQCSVARHVGDHRTSVVVTCRPDNLGFAGGHNFLMSRAVDHGAEYVFAANPDLEIAPGAIDCLIESAESSSDARIPTVHGPRLVLARRSGGQGTAAIATIDSDGIRWTKSRRHFDIDQGSPVTTPAETVATREGVTGAALMVSAQSYRAVVGASGYFFDPLFVAYREDAELGLRVLQLGGSCLVHRVPGFVHARGSVNGARNNSIQKQLGAQNRFLLKYRLAGGGSRVGGASAIARDMLVFTVALVAEPPSWTGVRRARRMRRTMRYRSRRVRTVGRASTDR